MARKTAGIKIVAVGAALLLWMFIKGGEEAEWVFEAPLSVEGVKEDLVLVGELPEFAIFEARGTMKTLASLKFHERRNNIHAVVDAAFLDEGEHREELSEDNIIFPPTSEIIQVHVIGPKAVQFLLDRAMTTELKVVPQVAGDPREGLYYRGASVEPEVVSIRGARSLLRGAKVVFTEEIDLSSAAGIIGQTAALDFSDLGRAESEPEEVTVTIKMEGTSSRVFEGVEGRVVYDEDNLIATARPSVFTVKVSGAESKVEELTGEDIGIVIDASGLDSGVHNVSPQISLPEGISLVSIEPAAPEVTLKQVE
jgi:YbbR domain-containing protein